jgi:hypothetical protein
MEKQERKVVARAGRIDSSAAGFLSGRCCGALGGRKRPDKRREGSLQSALFGSRPSIRILAPNLELAEYPS